MRKDGPTALEAASARPPDVVLLDVGMPGMSGFVLAERLTAQAPSKRPLLVAITGYSSDEDRRQAEEVGIDLYLLKPVEPDELRALLRRFQTVVC